MEHDVLHCSGEPAPGSELTDSTDRICPNCHRSTGDADDCVHCGSNTCLNGTWILEELLGHGASGHTWRARNARTGDPVAIKELSFRRLTDLKAVDLFQREGEALGAIDHPGVPRLHEQFVVEADRFVSAYLVQELIDGAVISLDDRTTEDEVQALLVEVAEILDALHRRRPPIVHRDVKPSNIMRRRDGGAVLIDFGSVRATPAESIGSTFAGTPGYMAPEQVLGRAEPASDFYALGATAVAMLAGRDAHELIDPHDRSAWRKKVEVSGPLADVLDRLLHPQPQARFSSAPSFATRCGASPSVERRRRAPPSNRTNRRARSPTNDLSTTTRALGGRSPSSRCSRSVPPPP